MKSVLSSGKIGNVEIKNRVIMPSMCVYFCDEEGYVSDTLYEYIRRRAEGGVGMFIIPGSPHGKAGRGRPAMSSNKYIAGWKRLADMVHGYGGKLFCQLHPAKMQAGRGEHGDSINDCSVDTLHSLTASYAECAARCREAGVDGVEIHGAHAHEVAQLSSPFYNKRQDEYGGSWKGMSHFYTDIIMAVKEKCGNDYPVIARISGNEFVEGGRTIEDSVALAKILEAAGADAIHVSCGMPESEWFISAPMDVEDCFNVKAAETVKKAVSIPVIAVNRISTMEEADEVIKSGAADFTAMARANLVDPEIVNKFAGVNPKPVRKCIGCNQGCRDAIKYKKICCTQNPVLGREDTLGAKRPPKNIKVMIAGAGPAGLEAACGLAERGIKPLIYEKNKVPGGLINLASLPPHKEKFKYVTDYRLETLKSYGIEINCGIEVTEELIKKENPDVLIIATGSVPFVPRIEGLDGEGIFTGDEVLGGVKLPGKNIALLGGGLIGCETAEYLASKGAKVDLFEMAEDIGTGLNLSRRHFMLERMGALGVKVHLLSKVLSVKLPAIETLTNGYKQSFEGFDAVVCAFGRKPYNELLNTAEKAFPKMRVIVIGDASKVGLATDAVYDGAVAAADV